MADPYAPRARAEQVARPAGEPPWLGVVAERGGALLGAVEDLETLPASPAFVAVACHGSGPLPPICRVGASQAVMLLLCNQERSSEAEAANRALAALGELEAPIYALKHGSVAGPAGTEGCFEVDAGVVAAVLDAAAEVSWERDPDFGYEVAASVPGLGGAAADALCPRLLYALHDRVYEHAAIVVERKRDRSARLAAIAGLAPEIVAASGWPNEPTAQGWKGEEG